MRGYIIFLLCCASAMALTGPLNYNGKEYYVVDSSNSAEDTGNEVCTLAGKACVGYTEPTDAVCRLAHPSAASSTSMSGDKAGVYCNGAPQAGVCSTLSDSCHTCPACTNTVSCNQEIGGLYREMYVECSGACKVFVNARDLSQLRGQISSLNSQLQACPQAISGPAARFVSNGNTIVDITLNSGGTESYTVAIRNNKVAGITSGAASVCVQRVAISETDLNNALQSSSLGQAIAYLFGANKVKVTGCTLLKKFTLFFVRPFARFGARRLVSAPPAPKPAPDCGQIGEQCNNRGCFSGMCGAPYEQNSDGQWGHWNYRCIDINDYRANCIGRGNTAPAWQCITHPCG